MTLTQAERFHALGPEQPEPRPEPKAVPKPRPEPEARREPAAAPEPMPDAEPEPPSPPSPQAVLLDAIRTELRIVLNGSAGGLSNAMLDHVRFGAVSSRGVVAELVRGAVLVEPRHPVVELALWSEGPARARFVSMLASSVFTAFNLGLEQVTDEHELEFHRAHAQHLGA